MWKDNPVKLTLLAIVILLTAACGQAATSPTLADSSPTPDCQFICNIDNQKASFSISCESDQPVIDTSKDSATEDYEQGKMVLVTYRLDRKMSYASSQHTYTLTGQVVFDQVANTVAYNVQATGGVFGDTPQLCKAGVLPIMTPAQPR